MGSDIWKSDINRRDFLRGGAALGLGGTAMWLAACVGTPNSAATTPTPINYPKAVIDGDLARQGAPKAQAAELVKLWQQRVDLMRQLVNARSIRTRYVGL